jgi:hypothetical protein
VANGERYSIRRLPTDPSVAASETPHPMQILNLERLPVPMHTVLKILLLLPLAALITAVYRPGHVWHVLACPAGDELHLRRLENRLADPHHRG